MKPFLSIFPLLLSSALFVSAQTPKPPPPFPSVPPGSPFGELKPPPRPPFTFPFDLKPSGFMSLRSEAPFRGVVTAKAVTDNSFTITIKRGETHTNTYQETGTSEDALKLVKYLVVGREYAFPAIFDKVLGPAKATPASPFPSIDSRVFRLLDLSKSDPFRAKVLSKDAKPGHVMLELERIGGGKETLTHSGNVDMTEARRLLDLLEVGELYEFPDALLPSATKEKKPAAEPSPAMKALEGLIGEWERPAVEQPDGRYTITHVWKKDGTGIWKEVRMERPDRPVPLKSEWLLTYDPKRKCYVERATIRSAAPPEITFTWNADTRAVLLREEQNRPKYGLVTYSVERKFITPDRIEWKSELKDQEGKVVEESSGAYLRVKQ